MTEYCIKCDQIKTNIDYVYMKKNNLIDEYVCKGVKMKILSYFCWNCKKFHTDNTICPKKLENWK